MDRWNESPLELRDLLEILGPLPSREILDLVAAREILGPLASREILGPLASREILGPLVAREILGPLVAREILGPLVAREILGPLIAREILRTLAAREIPDLLDALALREEKEAGLFQADECWRLPGAYHIIHLLNSVPCFLFNCCCISTCCTFNFTRYLLIQPTGASEVCVSVLCEGKWF